MEGLFSWVVPIGVKKVTITCHELGSPYQQAYGIFPSQ